MKRPIVILVFFLVSHLLLSGSDRHRVVVSTDIGGTDPDDFQSMVHLLLYADVLEIEGLIASPYGQGRKHHILEIIDLYEKDFQNLRTYSQQYPSPDELRRITKQGETQRAPYQGFRSSTPGSDWIVKCAKKADERPLHILVWGGIEDLAQALHDAPEILPKLRVHYIGGPNKKWGPDAYQYIVENHPELWIIESNSTYRGWFVGGEQTGPWGNQSFVEKHIKNSGHMGQYFYSHLEGKIKMGDTPTVGWLLQGDPSDPDQEGWGGAFVRAWERPCIDFDRLPNMGDQIEIFSVMQLNLNPDNCLPSNPEAHLLVENQRLSGYFDPQGGVHFRFCPKAAKRYHFRIESNVPELHGQEGQVEVFTPPPGFAKHPDSRIPHWWTDDPAAELAENGHHGAKTVNKWRVAYLSDFASRMRRCSAPSE